ncbi:MAG: TVP38/TMEM64 family protein [Sulfuricaulis sp.]|uniref:TVP38/TMEM64 family protein n=1 Tax=Sulfuricaulis sp. TaxID=2003553 RepID=UPI0034A219A7
MTAETRPHDSRRHAAVKTVIILILVAGLVAFFAFGGNDLLTLNTIKTHRDQLLAFAQERLWTALLLWGLLYAAVVALSIPGATVLSLAIGFVFGRVTGTLLIVVAATLGAILLFLGARYLFADAARERLVRNARAARLLQGFEHRAFHYLLFLRLVPLFPFWMVNLASAFTSVPLRTYALATVIGIIPGSFVFANLGRSLASIDSLDNLVSWEVLASFGLLGLFALLPIIFKRRIDTTQKGTL